MKTRFGLLKAQEALLHLEHFTSDKQRHHRSHHHKRVSLLLSIISKNCYIMVY